MDKNLFGMGFAYFQNVTFRKPLPERRAISLGGISYELSASAQNSSINL